VTKSALPQLPGILTLMLGGLLAACSGEKVERTEPSAPASTAALPQGEIALSADQIARLAIRFAPAEQADTAPIADVPAVIAPPPNARVAVAATIPGVVTRTFVVEGQSVSAGQQLAIVASREVLTMHAAMEQASARAAVARTSARRLDQLAREGVIAGARAEEADAGRREAEAELNEQRRTLALIHASGKAGSYALVAPISGKITKADVQTGMPVDGATAPYVIDAAQRLELTAQLPERLIRQVRPGMGIAWGKLRGTITSVGSVLDPATRSATLRATMPAAPDVIAGQATSVTLTKPAPAGSVIVPSEAVATIDGKPALFVRTRSGVMLRHVESAGEASGRTVLLSGVRAGDQVAVSGTSELKALAAN
jgi:membrane fusion protein, heavy metal efflux system